MLDANVADTPAGKPLAPETPSLDIPVAPVVICVMLVIAVLIQTFCVEDAAPAVLDCTVTVVAAEVALQPVVVFVTVTV